MKINFITNLSLNETSGGWSGISARTFEQLKNFSTVNYIGPINPKYPILQKAWSKLLRTIGLKGDFTLFAKSRLEKIAKKYLLLKKDKCDIDFFHGATPWLLCKPESKYVTYIDATFSLYLDIFSKQDMFRSKHIQSIIEMECRWLREAEAVFFGSDWVKDHAIKEYALCEDKCHTIWVGGNIPVPESDEFSGGIKFLFISLDFVKKGGLYCVEAFKSIRIEFPNAELTIIGQKPPLEVLETPGVNYVGYLRKGVKAELEYFQSLLSKATGLVHPTLMDTMGMVLIEAGYFGCPSITTRKFGIPELVKDKETGFLLDTPISTDQIVEFMRLLCNNNNNEDYYMLRKNAREYTSSNLTWEAYGRRIQNVLKKISI